MRRRELLTVLAGTGALSAASGRRRAGPSPLRDCGCAPQVINAAGMPPGGAAFGDVGSKLRITNMRVFGVTLDERIAQADRPYVFVKIETNQGVTGWGEATLEGKASAAMACVMDLKDLIIGSDPMQVEHLYQVMYLGSFYRGGPVLGSAISGIDQALWDIRGKAMGMPVYEMLGGPIDPRGVRGYYHASAWTLAEARELRDKTKAAGVTALKFQLPDLLEWVETNAKIKRAVEHMEMLREGLGPDLDFAVDFHARPSPTVAAIILREIEPLHLLFAEEICPPENVRAMARAVRHSTTPIATGERLIASYGYSELIDMGVVDILQPDIAHVGGVTVIEVDLRLAALTHGGTGDHENAAILLAASEDIRVERFIARRLPVVIGAVTFVRLPSQVIWPSEQHRTASIRMANTFWLSITACCRRLAIWPRAWTPTTPKCPSHPSCGRSGTSR